MSGYRRRGRGLSVGQAGLVLLGAGGVEGVLDAGWCWLESAEIRYAGQEALSILLTLGGCLIEASEHAHSFVVTLHCAIQKCLA